MRVSLESWICYLSVDLEKPKACQVLNEITGWKKDSSFFNSMNTGSFITINSTGGRIGRFCWVNSDLRRDHRSGQIATWNDGETAFIPDGWWGSTYFSFFHPRTKNSW